MWKKEYKKKKFYWRLKPDPVLARFLPRIPKGVALDIGAGEGRNSLFLAQNGFEVEAIDKIAEGLKKCKKIAKENNLSIKTKIIDVRKFKFLSNKYSLILSMATLDFLKKSEVEMIIKKIKKSLIKGGVVYLIVFSTKDPAFKKCKRKLKMIEENTFYLSKFKSFRHFFKKEEILNLLNDFKILKIEEKRLKDTSHDKPHFHQIIRIIAKK